MISDNGCMNKHKAGEMMNIAETGLFGKNIILCVLYVVFIVLYAGTCWIVACCDMASQLLPDQAVVSRLIDTGMSSTDTKYPKEHLGSPLIDLYSHTHETTPMCDSATGSTLVLGHTNLNVSFSSPPASVLTCRFCLHYCLEMPATPPFC